MVKVNLRHEEEVRGVLMLQKTDNRKSGLLMPVFSLPNAYGIGDFGPSADRFLSLLTDSGFSSWQLLPLTPIGTANSPYQSTSAYAGNPLYISPEALNSIGLLTCEELSSAQYFGDASRVDYRWLEQNRFTLLQKAYSRIDTSYRAAMDQFIVAESDWVEDYAAFSVIRQHQQNRPWWAWTDQSLVQKEPAAVKKFCADFHEEVNYIQFLAYEFSRQWQILREKANRSGVEIIGDIPIYVAADSADVWAHKHFFEIAEDNTLTSVAGVPPDYFSPEGQKWGNPLYDWQALKKDQYRWWIRRIQAGLNDYDCIRIDHFRGFERYFAIPGDAQTAQEGRWVRGPGLDLFDAIFRDFPQASIIAEDLGDIDDAVRSFLRQTGLPGMKVLQFSFDLHGSEIDRPHRYPVNCVAYSGTHDNTTLNSWLESLQPEQQQLVADYCGDSDLKSMLRCLWQTAAERVIIPVQDCLGLGAEARINTPGTMVNNWCYRFTEAHLKLIDQAYFSRLNALFGR